VARRVRRPSPIATRVRQPRTKATTSASTVDRRFRTIASRPCLKQSPGFTLPPGRSRSALSQQRHLHAGRRGAAASAAVSRQTDL
jgi:hypothetical protein